MKAGVAVALPALLAACATVPVEQGRAVSQRLEASVGAPAPWPQSKAEDAERRAAVDAALAEPLTPETAARVALANNPRVIAAFEALGVARAAQVDALLPPAPFLGALRLVPEHDEPAALKYKAGLDLLALLTLPATARAGQAEWDAAVAQATRETLLIAGEARSAMIAYIAARQEADLTAQAADAADASADASDLLFAAGNIAKVERDRERLFAEDVALADAAAQTALLSARERVNAALGLSGEAAASWTSIARLPPPGSEPVDAGAAERQAAQASLDFAIASGTLEAAKARRSVSWVRSLLPGLAIEGEREREDGEWKSGLGFELIAPIFDLGGAERLRLASTARREAALARAIEAELRAEARARAAEAESARRIALRRREVLAPLSSEVFEGAQRDFNAMEISLSELLNAKRQRLDQGLALVRSTRDYWLAQARLDLVLAGARQEGGVVAAASAGAPEKAAKGH